MPRIIPSKRKMTHAPDDRERLALDEAYAEFAHELEQRLENGQELFSRITSADRDSVYTRLRHLIEDGTPPVSVGNRRGAGSLVGERFVNGLMAQGLMYTGSVSLASPPVGEHKIDPLNLPIEQKIDPLNHPMDVDQAVHNAVVAAVQTDKKKGSQPWSWKKKYIYLAKRMRAQTFQRLKIAAALQRYKRAQFRAKNYRFNRVMGVRAMAASRFSRFRGFRRRGYSRSYRFSSFRYPNYYKRYRRY